MEMSIEDTKMHLFMQESYAIGKDYRALENALDIIKKYQKIKDIVSLNDEEFKQCGIKGLKEILEVIGDEKTDFEKLGRSQEDVDKKHKDLMMDCDMLRIKISRMMLTNDMIELNDMYEFVCKRIISIYFDNFRRLKSEVGDVDDK